VFSKDRLKKLANCWKGWNESRASSNPPCFWWLWFDF